MLRCDMSCHVMLYYVVCSVLLSCAKYFCVVLCYVVLCGVAWSSRIEELFPDFPISPKNQR